MNMMIGIAAAAVIILTFMGGYFLGRDTGYNEGRMDTLMDISKQKEEKKK